MSRSQLSVFITSPSVLMVPDAAVVCFFSCLQRYLDALLATLVYGTVPGAVSCCNQSTRWVCCTCYGSNTWQPGHSMVRCGHILSPVLPTPHLLSASLKLLHHCSTHCCCTPPPHLNIICCVVHGVCAACGSVMCCAAVPVIGWLWDGQTSCRGAWEGRSPPQEKQGGLGGRSPPPKHSGGLSGA